MMEVRLVIAHTVYRYKLSFAPGEDGSSMEADAIDISLMRPGRCDLCFQKRDIRAV